MQIDVGVYVEGQFCCCNLGGMYGEEGDVFLCICGLGGAR